jgi:parvulin-like peptidyl-prolyl isomerase
MFSRKALPFVLVASCVALAFAACSGTKKDNAIKVKTGLAGRVDDLKITQDQMLRMYEELPAAQKKEFKGRDGQANFVDKIIEQHLLYKAAIDDKLDRTDEMQERLRWATMNIVVAEYFSKNIADKIKVEPKEIEDYYAAHTAEFVQKPVMRAQYIFTTDSLKAVKLHKRLMQGEIFTTLATKESEDQSTAPAGGDLGYFNPGGYINGVGYSDIFSKAVEKLEVGKISGIIRFEKGFAIARVAEKNPEKVNTLDEARSTIEAKLNAKKTEEAYLVVVEKLKKKYQAENYVRERLGKTTRTPEELWEMVQIEPDPRNRIQYYRDLVNLYPNHKNAPEALFMIGFTYAEDIMDYQQARRTFDELDQKYPQSAMTESAKWMRENMETAHPKMESMGTMQQRMEADKTRKAEKGT